MPTKMITCIECGKKVTKRSTLSVGNGDRICRIHDEARKIKANEAADMMTRRIRREVLETLEAKLLRPTLVKHLRALREINFRAYNRGLISVGLEKGAEYRTDLKAEVELERTPFIEAAEYVIRILSEAHE